MALWIMDTRPLMEADLTEEEPEKIKGKTRRSFMEHRRNSPLPFHWRIVHSSRWMAQVIASEFSLLAFLLLLVMVFSRKWLNPSQCRFHQRYPKNITNNIYTSIHSMSKGLLYFCISKSCSSSDNGKDNFKLWTIHPIFGVAKMSFILALGLGFVLTAWLHLPYLPRLHRMPFYGLVSIILSFCEVTFIFLTLLLYPANLWIYELKRNVSIPIGWGYFIGWLVFILYFTCGILCYLNHKNFWSLIMSSSSINGSSNEVSQEELLMRNSQPPNSTDDLLDPAKQKGDQNPLGLANSLEPPYPANLG